MGSELWLYTWLSRLRFLNYRQKLAATAAVAIHLPVLVLILYLLAWSPARLATIVLVLAATSTGTGLAALMLRHLLRPIGLTAQALRDYRMQRAHYNLPQGFDDEAGILMADAADALDHLEAIRETLESLDEATGLPNRRKLLLLLAERIRLEERFGIAVLRFVNFPRLVETLERDQAERAARHMAQRIGRRLDNGILARISSTDFAWLHPIPEAVATLSPLARAARMTAGLRRIIEDSTHDLALPQLTVKPVLLGGIALFPGDGDTARALLDHAVAAAGQALPGAPVVLHSPAAREAAFERLRVEQELRRALDEEELCLHYQPIVDLRLGRTVGAEALVRWRHPERGLILPGHFIPAAESTGMIKPLGLWVLNEACGQLRDWQAQGLGALKLAVNISASEFADPTLPGQLARVIGQYGIDPGLLDIELSETAAMIDHDHTAGTFAALRELGVGIVIDDFGTGYASMSRLRRLPFDTLKIDREFVASVDTMPDAQAMCRALVALAGGLGLQIQAAGAETEGEARYLRGLDCHLLQGFLFSRPLPAEHFAAAIAAMPIRL